MAFFMFVGLEGAMRKIVFSNKSEMWKNGQRNHAILSTVLRTTHSMQVFTEQTIFLVPRFLLFSCLWTLKASRAKCSVWAVAKHGGTTNVVNSALEHFGANHIPRKFSQRKQFWKSPTFCVFVSFESIVCQITTKNNAMRGVRGQLKDSCVFCLEVWCDVNNACWSSLVCLKTESLIWTIRRCHWMLTAN